MCLQVPHQLFGFIRGQDEDPACLRVEQGQLLLFEGQAWRARSLAKDD